MTNIETRALGIIADYHRGCTILDLWQAGLERGRNLHEALRTLEADGQITNRLEFATSRHRIYKATRTYG